MAPSTPKSTLPITFEQAVQLEVDQLVAEIARLENSIAHLQRTQDELLAFLTESPEDDEDGELRKAVNENKGAIAQNERIALIKTALASKVGEDAARHYGLSAGQLDAPFDSHQRRAAVPPVEAVASGVHQEEDGMYL